MSRRASRILRWILVAAWATGIFAVSAVPGSGLPGGFSVQAHFLEYGILAMLIYRALETDRPAVSTALLAIAIASAYGVSDEIHQAFVPLRTPDVRDWLVDTAGAVAGVALMLALSRSAGRRRG